MLCGIRLLLMPDLSTSAESVGRFCVLFLLAVRPLRASFPLSDDRDVEPPGHEGWLQDRPEENGPDRRGRGPIPGHGTRQFPRVEANQIGQESSPSLLKSGCFDRSEEQTSELQSLMRISYAVFCLKKKKRINLIKS